MFHRECIFNWLKNNNVSNNEMLKTFNCGVGFCLIINRSNHSIWQLMVLSTNSSIRFNDSEIEVLPVLTIKGFSL